MDVDKYMYGIIRTNSEIRFFYAQHVYVDLELFTCVLVMASETLYPSCPH